MDEWLAERERNLYTTAWSPRRFFYSMTCLKIYLDADVDPDSGGPIGSQQKWDPISGKIVCALIFIPHLYALDGAQSLRLFESP